MASGMLRGVTFDVLVVLGCRVANGRLSPAALRRVERAAQAYHDDGAQLVIATGGKMWQGSRESQVFVRELTARGVAAEHLLEEQESLNTRGNARGVARLLQGKLSSRLGLITCDWHMPRALRLFRLLGLAPIALPAPSPTRKAPVVALRVLRETGSLAFDLLLAPLWLRS